MNNEEFFEQFGHLAEAPDGIARMKQLILGLAVRGRLVAQDPSDEPASGLLDRIAEERERLIAEKKIRKSKPISAVKTGEAPHEIPSGWVWCRLGALGPIIGGGTPKSGDSKNFSEDGGIPWLTPADLSGHEGQLISRGKRFLTDVGLATSSATLMPKGSVLFSSRAPIGYAAIAANPISTNQGFKSVVPLGGMSSEYLFWVLVGAVPRIRRASSGTTFAEVSGAVMAKVEIPVAPLAEQRRIVERVRELLVVCDELDKAQVEARDLRDATARSSLSALVESNRVQTEQALTIIQKHMRLCLRPGDGASEVVTGLRKAILDLAVRGRLVPQDPNDESASVLLERIAGERERMIAEKKLKRGKPVPSIGSAGAPYEVPSGWAWVRLASIVEHRLGKMLDASRNTGELRPYLRGVNVRWGEIDLSDVKQMRIEERDLAEYSLRDGDILVCEGGEAGRCAIWDRPGIEMYFQKALHRLRPLGGIEPAFVLLSLTAAHHDGRIERRLTGTTIKHLPGEKIALVEIALPPLHEQRQIAERVAELLALCDDLEMRLLGERRLATELADSAVNSLVSHVV